MATRVVLLSRWHELQSIFPILSFQERLIDKADDFNYCAFNGAMLLSPYRYKVQLSDFAEIADILTPSTEEEW